MSSVINDVSDTSFWVAYYRAIETDRRDALFRDELARKLVGDRGRLISQGMGNIGRYTQWSVVARTVIIDRFIEQQIRGGVDAIINLGAGLDTRPYRMSFPEGFEWVEVDHPGVIDHKTTVLADQKPKLHLTRIAMDLAKRDERQEFFRTVLPKAKKVMILTEGVIIYLSSEQVTELAQDLLMQRRFKFWVTEYFDRRVYRYLKATVRTAKMKNAPFRFYPDDWIGFFLNLGWVEKERQYSRNTAVESNRRAPMPWYARLLMPLLPPAIERQSRELVGYAIFQRGDDVSS